MANRFISTNFFKSQFVRGLKGALKGLYTYIITDCTPSGIWFIDLQIASIYIGFDISMAEFDETFVQTGKAIDLGGGKYFFPDFIEHQYPSGLQANNKAHKNIIFELKKLNLIDENLSPIEAPLKPLHSIPKSTPGLGLGLGIGLGIGLKEGGMGETDVGETDVGEPNATVAEIEAILTQLQSFDAETKIPENEKTYFVMLVVKMVEIFVKENPAYFRQKELDYSACLKIAYHIAEMNHWTKASVVNGQLDACLTEWEIIVAFIRSDDWLSSRSLSDLSTPKEWQRLVLKKEKQKKDGKNSKGNRGVGREPPTDKF